MSYRIQVGNQQISVSISQFEELREAMHLHVMGGFRDGETRFDSVTITECGEPIKSTKEKTR